MRGSILLLFSVRVLQVYFAIVSSNSDESLEASVDRTATTGCPIHRDVSLDCSIKTYMIALRMMCSCVEGSGGFGPTANTLCLYILSQAMKKLQEPQAKFSRAEMHVDSDRVRSTIL